MMADMTTYRTARRTCQGIALVAIIGLLSACGGSDDATPAAEPASETTPSEIGDAAESAEAEPDSEPEAAPPAAPSGGGSATLSLDNGESFEFSVICTLEPQIAAGSEILFTATSLSSDDPAIDITQFGDEGPVVDIASISVYDASFESLWEAESTFDAFGGPTELSLDGSTITGSGTFFPGGDIALVPVVGTVVANC